MPNEIISDFEQAAKALDDNLFEMGGNSEIFSQLWVMRDSFRRMKNLAKWCAVRAVVWENIAGGHNPEEIDLAKAAEELMEKEIAYSKPLAAEESSQDSSAAKQAA